MHLRTTIPLVVFLARASAQFHRMEIPDATRPVAAECPATAYMPKCAVNCIDTAAAANGCAPPSDLTCQCKNYSKIQKAAAPCVITACAAKAPDVESIASEICSQCAGIPVAAAVMAETIVIDDAVARTARNYFKWAAEPTGRVVAPRRNRDEDEVTDEQAERKKWMTMPRIDHRSYVAKETGLPVPRQAFDEEIGPAQEAERKKWNNNMPRDEMREDMAESENKRLLNSRKGPELPDCGSDKTVFENMRLNSRGGPELPDFGEDKIASGSMRLNSRKGPELPDFGSDKYELHPFNKDCSMAGKGGSEGLRSCEDEHDWDHDHHFEGNQDLALARTRTNTVKRRIDYIYEQEQERLRLVKEMMMEKEGRKMNKDSEQRKWI
ncbi:hypothetical protein B0T21DRAFT_415022 [Apiosordaria backusii]|uniref:CFEM domain-containing protein n=1 Tax=Apiosordaria backusii TaxID=314023 RepID=A0AA40ANC0_9PEZI|nr:hypothetical protein B0T21DRAFT_415022 [Apiosordaria backusii]